MPIVLNSLTKIIQVTSPTTSITVQELVDSCRDWEDELENLGYLKVIDAVGKDDLGGSVYTSITLTLSGVWQIQFWNGVTIGYIKEGTVVGGVGGNPVAATGGTDTIIVNNTVGGTIAVSGSGVTDQDKTDIVDGVFDEVLSGHTIAGTFGKSIADIEDGSGGKWEIVSNQMVIYKADNTTELMRFNLFDSSGNPAMTDVYKRERV